MLYEKYNISARVTLCFELSRVIYRDKYNNLYLYLEDEVLAYVPPKF